MEEYNPHSACPIADLGFIASALRAVLILLQAGKSEIKSFLTSWRRCIEWSIVGLVWMFPSLPIAISREFVSFPPSLAIAAIHQMVGISRCLTLAQ